MNIKSEKYHLSKSTLAKGLVVLIAFGLCAYAAEHVGGEYISHVSAFVSEQGKLGPAFFVTINAIAIMLLIPQTLFTVAAGALFGWKFGTVWASVGMTLGATGSFFIARYGVREWIRNRFEHHVVFRKMQRLSLSHPLHVISLSRLIPVVPFPVASYLLGVTEVRSLPYALLTWACMLPETLFMASGGHLLHSGIAHGHASIEAIVVLVVAGVTLGMVAHRMKKKFLEDSDED